MISRSMILATCGAMLIGSLPTDASAFALDARPSAGAAVPGVFDASDSPSAVPIDATRPKAQRRGEAQVPIRLAQSGDELLRINQLEDEVRKLTGKVEELSFQLLQAQEDMRKRQEDTEFRFQQLEGGSGSGAGGSSSGQKRGDAAPSAPPANRTASAPPPSSPTPPAGGPDDIGQILQGAGDVGSSATTTNAPKASSSSKVAAIKPQGSGELYALAYNYLLAGDYELAEQAFRQYSQTYPSASDAPDAQYWLGESLYQQKKYTDAAEVFLDAQKAHPDNGKAPEMMLKLGMSLAKLKNSDTACVTYKEVARRYPEMSANVKTKLAAEEKAASC